MLIIIIEIIVKGVIMKKYIFFIVMLFFIVIFCFSFIGKDISKVFDINFEELLIYGVDDILIDLRSVINLFKW